MYWTTIKKETKPPRNLQENDKGNYAFLNVFYASVFLLAQII